jgi:hypothetical protein
MNRTSAASKEFMQTVAHLKGAGKQINQNYQDNQPKVKASEAGANEQVQTPTDHKKPTKKSLSAEKDCQ